MLDKRFEENKNYTNILREEKPRHKQKKDIIILIILEVIDFLVI